MLTRSIALMLPLLAATLSAQPTETWRAEAYGEKFMTQSSMTLDLSISDEGELRITGGTPGMPVWLLGGFKSDDSSLTPLNIKGVLLVAEPIVLGIANLDSNGEYSARMVPPSVPGTATVFTQSVSVNAEIEAQLSQGLRFDFDVPETKSDEPKKK